MVRSLFLSCLSVAVAGFSLTGSNADAGLTPIGPAGAHEATQEQILEHVYGAGLSRSGSDFVGPNGLTIRRVDDAADRSIAFDGPTRVDLVAAFTDWKWDYSMRDAAGRRVGGGSQAGSGFDAHGGFTVSGDRKHLQFVLDHGANHELRSDDSVDQLVTYTVSGPDGRNETMFFWEDWTRRQHPLGDFNDLVFRAVPTGANSDGSAVKAAPSAVSIPLPPGAWTGAAGLLGVMVASARRFRR